MQLQTHLISGKFKRVIIDIYFMGMIFPLILTNIFLFYLIFLFIKLQYLSLLMIRAGKHGTKKIINKEGNKMKDFL